MSEIEALLGLYGAIDRAVVEGEADHASLAPLLGAYRDGAAVGWYDNQYLPWAESLRKRPLDAEFPAAETAFLAESVPEEKAPVVLSPRAHEIRDALTAFPPDPIEGRIAARRILAVTAAARALPQHFGSEGSHADVARAALVIKHDLDPDGVAADHRSQQLHTRLADQFTSMSDWARVVDDAVREGSLPPDFQSHGTAPPCTGRLIMRPGPDGDPDPCTVLEAEFITNKVSFEDAKRYLEPSNWQFPGSLWCRMEKVEPALGPNSWLYHETVATSCPPTPGGWSVSTDLQFWFSHPTANEARVEYDLGPGLPQSGSDIEIDEGSLRIIDIGGGDIQVKTTKRVRFTGSFDGAGLAMFMCASGYSTVLEDMVFSVADASSTSVKQFPVPAPQGGPMPSSSSSAKKPAFSATTTPPADDATEDTLDAIAADTAAFVESYLKDASATYTSSLAQIQAGTYKVENAWADGIKMWSTYMSGMGKAFELGTRAAKVYPKKTTDES